MVGVEVEVAVKSLAWVSRPRPRSLLLSVRCSSFSFWEILFCLL